MPARIIATSALCSAGRGVEQVWASVRAGLSRIGSSPVMDRHLEPIRMGLVPEDALEPELPPEVESLPLPARARRMLRLGVPALRAVLQEAGEPPLRLFLGLPQLALGEAPWMRGFSLYLAKAAGAELDVPSCRVVPAGRAAALVALELALAALEQDPARAVVVGGIDTYLDLKLLASLEAEGRILGHAVSDGFIPGEGASFLVLAHASAAAGEGAGASVEAAASAQDPGHRSGSAPARGEGLSTAIEQLRGRLADPGALVGTIFAGLNGESFDAKQWGVARLRHAEFFSPDAGLSHPADCFADPGAAMGALLLALGARAIARGERRGPALIWAASDGETRACALLSRAEN
jgi:3-oxoacyl-[acyl-carrier-protein] synthase I